MSQIVDRIKLGGCPTLVETLQCLLEPYQYLPNKKISKQFGMSREQGSRMLGGIGIHDRPRIADQSLLLCYSLQRTSQEVIVAAQAHEARRRDSTAPSDQDEDGRGIWYEETDQAKQSGIGKALG